MMRSVVDLPQPEGPTTTRSSPFFTAIEISASAAGSSSPLAARAGRPLSSSKRFET
jgi:hypothetical protein